MKHFGALLLAFLAFPVLAAPSERPRIGLVLGGGGAKGFAHIPVLKCLDELDIPIDYVAGTSAGGVVGALYAAGYSGSEIERIGRAIDWFDFFTDRPHRSLLPFLEKNEDGRYQLEFFLRGGVPTAPSGLLHGQKFTQLFSALTFPLPGDLDFDRLPIPFRCVAVDLITGQQVVLRKGSLVKAMRATMAVPTMFSPVEWGDYLLMDGGVLNNLPVDVVKDMGADIVIAVDLGSPLFEKEELNSADKILTQTLRIVEIEQTSQKRQTADILIIPDMKGVGSLDYFFSDKLSTIFERGEAAAREILPALAALKEKYGLKRLEETGASPAIQRQKKFILEQVTVRGNEKLPASFISRSFGLRRGEPVDGRTLDRRVTELYALGYFENVQCSVYPLEGDRLDIELSVKEVPRGKLRVGLGYDNFRKLVVATGVVLTHLPLPGIRLDSALDMAGLTRFRSRISFSPQTFDFPLYPFLEVHYQGIPTRLYDGDGARLATYQRNSWTSAIGVGLLLARGLNLELSYEVENMDIDALRAAPYPELLSGRRDHLQRFGLRATVDTLDSCWTPKKGFFLQADYEGSYDFTGTSNPYERFEARLDLYGTLLRKHTLRFYGYWGMSSAEVPYHKFFNQGNPATFVGMEYDQLSGNQMKILRAEYRYQITRLIHLKAAANIALDFEQQWSNVVYAPDLLWGMGAGLHISTPAGPLDFIYSVGSKSFLEPRARQGVVYLVLGAKF